MKNTILIVDDIKKNLELLATILYNVPYNVLFASSGERALEIASLKNPDLILLDIMMPNMNGYEVCQRLKGEEATRDIPVLFITARTEEYAVIEGFEVGAVDYIVKPFNKAELLARVATHLKIKNQQDFIYRQKNELKKKNSDLEKLNQNLKTANEVIISSTEKFVRAEKEFRSIFNNIGDIFYRTNMNGDILMISPSGQKIFGKEKLNNLTTKHVKQTFVDLEQRTKMVNKLLKDEKIDNFLLHLKNYKDEIFFVEANSYLIFDKEKQPIAIEGILRDVTEQHELEEILKEERQKLNSIFRNVQSGIVLIDAETYKIVDANPAALKLLKDINAYQKNKDCRVICSLRGEELECPMISKKQLTNQECLIINKYEEKTPILKSITEIKIRDKKYFLETFTDISKQKKMQRELRKKNKKIEDQNKEIISSINYAYKIQNALLPSEDFMKNYLPENFIFFQPKDIISGDFYWTKQINNTFFVAVADCTGHGVPGAFISTIAITMLNEIVGRRYILETDKILNELRQQIILLLHQDHIRAKTIHDGLDIALCSIDLYDYKMSYSGAYNSLVYITKDKKTEEFELIEVKADKMPISSFVKMPPFKKHDIQLKENDKIYLFSDGFQDQIGELSQKKFYKKYFKKLLLENSHLPMDEQKIILKDAFTLWKGDFMQIDDVTIIGMKVSINFGDVDLF